jgi:hypothetical protein
VLGELFGEASGKITGTRVLPSEDGQIKIEVSFQGQGTLLGQPITDLGTYTQTMRPNGTLYGEGHVLMLAQDGSVADWIGGGVGRQIGAGWKGTYGVFGSFQTATGSLADVAKTANAIEYETEEDGSYRWQAWHWTGARFPASAKAGPNSATKVPAGRR